MDRKGFADSRGSGSMTTKGIVSIFLVYFGIATLVQSLLWWNVYGVGGADSAVAFATFAMSIGFFLAAIFVWKKWEE